MSPSSRCSIRVRSLHQRLAPGVGIDLGARRLGPSSEQEADDLQRGARFARALLAGRVDQRQRAQQPALDLVRLGIFCEAEHVAREIRDDTIRSDCGADACTGSNDDRFAWRDALEERAHQRSLADAGVADDHDLSLAAGDEDVAPRVAQRLELEIAAVQTLGVTALA